MTGPGQNKQEEEEDCQDFEKRLEQALEIADNSEDD